jgi:soluble lytic murein transglycosylase-like protein
MTTAHIRAAIESTAAKHGLDVNLVEAVVLTESGGNPFAWNPEPRYRYLVDVRTMRPFRPMTEAEVFAKTPPADFKALAGDPDQEWWGQQASWGLMQVMGALAREQGFRAHYLPELTDPMTGLHFGCKHLAGLLAWTKGNTDQAIAAYNAGRGGWRSEAGQRYVTKVKGNLAHLQGVRRA